MDARNSAIAQQPLQRSAVVGFDADTGVHREAAVFVAQHVFGVTVLQQAPSNEGAQDAFFCSVVCTEATVAASMPVAA